MRDPLNDGHQLTPNSSPSGCAGVEQFSGNFGLTSDGLGRDFKSSCEPCFMDSTSVPLDKNLGDNSEVHMGQDVIILDAGCSSDDMHDGRSSTFVKADGISSSAGVGGVLPLPHRDKECMDMENLQVFSAKRSTCNEFSLHNFSSADHSFNMGSSSNARQKLPSSKSSGVCTSGDYNFVEEKLKVHNSIPLGSMNSLHVFFLHNLFVAFNIVCNKRVQQLKMTKRSIINQEKLHVMQLLEQAEKQNTDCFHVQ